MAKTICTVLGVIFLLVGVVGFVAPTLGGFHLSLAHNLIHIVSGALALYFGLGARLAAARLFSIIFGVVYGLLGVVGFAAGSPAVPSMAGMSADNHLLKILPGALEFGTSDHAFHILLGIVFIAAGVLSRIETSRDAR